MSSPTGKIRSYRKGAAISDSDDKPRWLREIQDSMDRASAAFRHAWEATRDDRASALDTARNAARELGELFDQGITAARERWEATQPTGETTEEE